MENAQPQNRKAPRCVWTHDLSNNGNYTKTYKKFINQFLSFLHDISRKDQPAHGKVEAPKKQKKKIEEIPCLFIISASISLHFNRSQHISAGVWQRQLNSLIRCLGDVSSVGGVLRDRHTGFLSAEGISRKPGLFGEDGSSVLLSYSVFIHA